MMNYPKYESYKDSGIDWLGEIPKDWIICNLRYAMSFLNYKRIPLSALERENRKGAYPYYGASGIIDYVNDYIFDEELILIAEDGANLLSKSTPLAFLASGKYWVNNHAHILKPRSQSMLFWSNLLSNIDYTIYITGAAQPKLSRENLGGVRIPVPSIQEQNLIAKFLDQKTTQLDEAISIKEKQIELLKEQKQIMIQNAVTKGLDPNVKMKDSGVDWIGEIPEHWEVRRVKTIFQLITEQAPKNNTFELLSVYTEIGVKPRKDLEEKGNKASTTDGYWMVKKGDFIVNKLLAWMGAVGISEFTGVTSPAYDILRPFVALDGYYYHNLFRNPIFTSVMRQNSKGIMDMRLRLYFDKFGDIKIPFPPLEQQQCIAKFIEQKTVQNDTGIALLKKEIDFLKEYKTTLINRAVTGKIKVTPEIVGEA